MGSREELSTVSQRLWLTLTGALLAVAASGCGSSDFANEPRPPVPIDITANVTSNQVVVSPNRVGGGLADFTVTNQSDSPVRFTLVGPAPQDNQQSGDIPPGGVGSLKASLHEGRYEATAGGGNSRISPDTITVGAERKSAQNDLLLP